ncbi:hypothetical protein ABEB36_011274 [Hypothenemus hampei]|uniref:Uncharacterized protein n=1 Tax=Hypothenemus hampei TaxID=57062 RepID=A0ABD1EEU2_HYPHA
MEGAPLKKRPIITTASDTEISENESESCISSPEHPLKVVVSSEDEHMSQYDDMTLTELELCRKKLLKEIRFLGKEFKSIKQQIYEEKMNQLEIEASELQTGVSANYMAELKKLEAELFIRNEVAEMLHDEQIKAINRHYEAEKQSALQTLENNKRLAYEECRQDLLETIRKLQEDNRDAEIVWGEEEKWGAKKKKPVVRAKKAVTVSGPYIVYMLKPEEIKEDWTIIKKSCQDL